MNKIKTKIKNIRIEKGKAIHLGIRIAEYILVSSLFSLTAQAAYASDINQKNIEALVNKEREYRGLKDLRVNPALTIAAYSKAQDMAQKNYFEHYAFGKTPWDFILAQNYNYLYAGENLAMDFNTSEGVVSAWMNSPTHRDNILNPNYDEMGVGIVKGTYSDNTGSRTTIMVDNMFGKRKPVPLAMVEDLISQIVKIFQK